MKDMILLDNVAIYEKNTLKHCEEVEKYFCNNFITPLMNEG